MNRSRRLKCLAASLLVLALSGCATPPQRPSEVGVSSVYTEDRDAVLRRLREILVSYRIGPGTYDPTRSLLRAERRDLGPTGWAICQPLRVRDPDGERLREVEPLRLDLELVVDLEEAGTGTQVTVRPRFLQTSLNTFTNLEVTHGCRSTGALERDILSALEGERA